MNTQTGELLYVNDLEQLPPEERRHYIQVDRHLSLKEHNDMQIRLYSKCGCGSGKKFKFCCQKP